MNPRQLFLDCDGVLADFDALAEEIFGLPPREAEDKLGTDQFWAAIRAHHDFYYKLPVLKNATRLVDALKHLNPIVLTGVPHGGWAEDQKQRWVQKHFPELNIITCRSKEKRLHMNPGDVLVDDWPKYKPLWEEFGGHFLLYQPDKVEDAIRQVLAIFTQS